MRTDGSDKYTIQKIGNYNDWGFYKNFHKNANCTIYMKETGDMYPWEETQCVYNEKMHISDIQKMTQVKEVGLSKSNSSNRELLLEKQAIKIAAYWKTMCKAFIDRAVKMARLYLVVRPCSEKVLFIFAKFTYIYVILYEHNQNKIKDSVTLT